MFKNVLTVSFLHTKFYNNDAMKKLIAVFSFFSFLGLAF